MRNPTPVTTSSITAESGSESRPNGTWKVPAVIHVHSVTSLTRCAGATPSIEMRSATARPNPISTTPQPIRAMTASGSARPNRPSATNPTSGASRMNGVRFNILALQGVQLIHINVGAAAEDRDDDGKPNHDLRGGDRQRQKDEDPPLRRVEEVREGHEREIDGVEHQFNGHEHNQRILAHEHAERADGEQDSADCQKGGEWHRVTSWAPYSSACVGRRPSV